MHYFVFYYSILNVNAFEISILYRNFGFTGSKLTTVSHRETKIYYSNEKSFQKMLSNTDENKRRWLKYLAFDGNELCH